MPQRCHPGDRLQHRGQLVDREERPGEQEHRHDHEPEQHAKPLSPRPGGPRRRRSAPRKPARQHGGGQGEQRPPATDRAEQPGHHEETPRGDRQPAPHVGHVARATMSVPAAASPASRGTSGPLHRGRDRVGRLPDAVCMACAASTPGAMNATYHAVPPSPPSTSVPRPKPIAARKSPATGSCRTASRARCAGRPPPVGEGREPDVGRPAAIWRRVDVSASPSAAHQSTSVRPVSRRKTSSSVERRTSTDSRREPRSCTVAWPCRRRRRRAAAGRAAPPRASAMPSTFSA